MKNIPSYFDPVVPTDSSCVVPILLSLASENRPQETCVVFEDQSSMSYEDLWSAVRARAAALQKLGVSKDDRVVVWLKNGKDLLLSWFAVNLIGGCFIPINPALRGGVLSTVLTNSNARLLICYNELLDRLEPIDTGALTTLVTVDALSPSCVKELQVLGERHLKGSESDLRPVPLLEPWDIGYIIYTSGTTGPSKGVLVSYYQMWNIAEAAYGYITNADRVMVNMPLYHVAALGTTVAVLVNQASMYLTDGFRARQFWEDVVRENCTVSCGLVGTMAQYLDKHSDPKYMTENPLRISPMFPISPQTVAFCKKYGIDYIGAYGSTEVPICLVGEINMKRYGSAGIPRSGVQCRLVDDNDIEVPHGAVGELIVRSDYPWAITSGYNGMPEATANAWRNGWFHTGDLFKQDEDGYYYFVDRKKDVIRRRGENISSFEVENAATQHPAVLEAAAIGIPAEYGEEDVFLAVTLRDTDDTFDERSLFDFLQSELAHFMLPRYIRIMSSLPKTPSNKVQKHLLRAEGVVQGAWDREDEGIIIKRDKLTSV